MRWVYLALVAALLINSWTWLFMHANKIIWNINSDTIRAVDCLSRLQSGNKLIDSQAELSTSILISNQQHYNDTNMRILIRAALWPWSCAETWFLLIAFLSFPYSWNKVFFKKTLWHIHMSQKCFILIVFCTISSNQTNRG